MPEKCCIYCSKRINSNLPRVTIHEEGKLKKRNNRKSSYLLKYKSLSLNQNEKMPSGDK